MIGDGTYRESDRCKVCLLMPHECDCTLAHTRISKVSAAT